MSFLEEASRLQGDKVLAETRSLTLAFFDTNSRSSIERQYRTGQDFHLPLLPASGSLEFRSFGSLYVMAPKKSSSGATPPPTKPIPSHSRAHSSSTPSTAPSKPSSSLSNKSSPQDVALHVWDQYLQNTPSRTLLLDAFMAFLVLVGGIQFLYAVIGGNYVSYDPTRSPSRNTQG
jgi:hypothetical protein